MSVEEKNNEDLVLLNYWPSPFAMRVKIALAEKGVEYECRDENFPTNKSQLLLQMNPIHKAVPVLVHKGKPICESLLIVQYIDEYWHDQSPLLPSDPYERAQARFWADFIDKKLYESMTGRKIYMNTGPGDELEAAKKEFISFLNVLEEKALGDKPYFAGNEFGFLDIVFIPCYTWFYTYETLGGFKVEDSHPKITAWAKRCFERDSVAKSLPDSRKVCEFVLQRRERLGIA